jgi:hypothetical protein
MANIRVGLIPNAMDRPFRLAVVIIRFQLELFCTLVAALDLVEQRLNPKIAAQRMKKGLFKLE